MSWSREGTELARPWFYLGRLPMHSATLLVAVFVLSMVVMTFLLAGGAAEAVAALVLTRGGLFSGKLWQLLTWPLVNFPDLWFAISMVFLYVFGRDVERTLGRVDFLKLAGGIGATLMVLTVLLPGARLAGSWSIGLGVFLAFAIMSPNALLIPFLNLTAKWWAIILLALNALMALAARDWPGLALLAGVVVATAVTLKWLGAASTLPWLVLPTIKFAGSRSPTVRESDRSRPVATSATASQARIDALLDKVTAQGLHSLTDEERRLLSDASQTLQRRK